MDKPTLPEFDPSMYIWDDHPTQETLSRCESEHKVLCSLIEVDSAFTSRKEQIDLIDKFLHDHKLRQSSYHFIWYVTKRENKEEARSAIMEYLRRTYENPAQRVMFATTGFGGSNGEPMSKDLMA